MYSEEDFEPNFLFKNLIFLLPFRNLSEKLPKLGFKDCFQRVRGFILSNVLTEIFAVHATTFGE